MTDDLRWKLERAIEALVDIASVDDYAGPGLDPDDVNGGFDSPGDARRARQALKEIGYVG